MSADEHGRYVLVHMLLPSERTLYGEYDIKLVGDGSDVVLDELRHEVVEFGLNASAAEWGRLHSLKEDLTKAAEVMGS